MTLMRLIAIKYFKRLTALIITSLTDKALAWATAIWQLQGPECSDITLFTNEMLRILDQSALQTGFRTTPSLFFGRGEWLE